MASKVVRYPLSQATKRGLAAQAAVKESAESLPHPDIKCTVMPNKLMVSSIDLGGPLSRVSIAFRAGPRNETEKNQGISHVVRSMAGFTTQRCTGFAILRNLQQNGIYFSCVGDREITAFNVVAARNKINCALKYLSAVATAPAFKPWQIIDNYPRLKYEVGSLTPQAKTVDLLHKAAFRTGLGNSLFLKKDYIGSHTHEMLSSFYRESFTSNRCSLAAYNINHNDMIEFSKGFDLAENEPLPGNSKYFGGEIRKEKKSYFAHIAVATEGVGMKDIKEALSFSVLQHAYGVPPAVVWGGSPSPLYKATNPIAPDAGVSCFNVSYSDTGLFGFFITGSGKSAGKVVEAALKVLKSGSVSEADLKRAKAMVKMNLLAASENSETLIEDMGIQSLCGGVIIPATVLAEALEKITLSDVSAVAKKVAKGKFSLAAYGDLSCVPYLADLN